MQLLDRTPAVSAIAITAFVLLGPPVAVAEFQDEFEWYAQ